MNIESLLFTILTIVKHSIGNEFDYPDTMPPPMDAQIASYYIVIPYILEYESPIQIRLGSAYDSTFYNCMAVYDPVSFDIFTKKAPRVRASDDIINNYGNANSMALCALYANLIVMTQIVPDSSDAFVILLDSYGLDTSSKTLDSSVSECINDSIDCVCLKSVASKQNYSPKIMGSIVAAQVLHYLANDGWNADGSINRYGDGQCTANCRPYSDITGYEPEYGDLDRWQPLEENNGKGFFCRYDHVVPHIGFTAKTKFTSRKTLKERSSPNPDYDYNKETELVIERLEELATNDTQKMLVEIFDDKLAVGAAVLYSLYPSFNWTYQQRVRFAVGYTIAEYEAIIHAWREKRIWDMVRPTTLIKNGFGGDTITTYGGPYQGVQIIDAEDFESYKRVMPHSEYPSGSGCICLAMAQYVTKYIAEEYESTDPLSVNMPFATGSSKNEPGVVPANDILVTLKSMDELNEICGESRLWGGMHFTASIQGAWQLCDGIGEEAYDFVVNIAAGNVNAFDDEEEIPDFEDEYKFEMKEMKKKLKRRKKDKVDDVMMF